MVSRFKTSMDASRSSSKGADWAPDGVHLLRLELLLLDGKVHRIFHHEREDHHENAGNDVRDSRRELVE